jgi:ring-1,2-phenylacetyl-CoA epoxidase subunit PaaE
MDFSLNLRTFKYNMSSPKFHSLKVKAIKRETSDSVSITLDVPQDLKNDYTFTQGQYITFKKIFDGEELRRSYSICSSPLDGELRVGIKQVENGKFSTYANAQLHVGDIVEVMTPMGNFFTELNPANSKQYLAFAAGSGITPIMSIIKTTLAIEKDSNFTLVYSNKNTGSIMFLEEIEALKNIYLERLTVFHLLSRETVDVPVLNGRISKEKCIEFADKNLIDYKSMNEVFVCGPEDMIHAVKDTLAERGVDSKHIHFELFSTPTQAQANSKGHLQAQSASDNEAKAQVSVKIDGITYQLELPYAGESILDAALKTGADLPFACKGGVCCTCRAKLMKGTASMDMNFSLEDDEVEKGYILTCQAHPTSEELFVDFDVR